MIRGPAAQVGAGVILVGREFRLDHLEVGHRVTVRILGRGGTVEHVHQHGTPFHVPEEVQAQPLALAGPGDQAGHVGHYELGVPRLDHAEVRGERGERVVAHLGLGRGQRADQRGLARVGETDQPGVGHRLELEHQGDLGARLTAQREPGGLAFGRRERRVTQAAAAALRRDVPGSGADQVGQHLAVLGLDHGAVRDPDDQVGPGCPVPVGPRALLAVGGPADRAPVEVEQGGHAGMNFQDHVAAPAAVTAVRAAQRLELLPVHRGAAVTAVTRLGPQECPVCELRHGPPSLGSDMRQGRTVSGPPLPRCLPLRVLKTQCAENSVC